MVWTTLGQYSNQRWAFLTILVCRWLLREILVEWCQHMAIIGISPLGAMDAGQQFKLSIIQLIFSSITRGNHPSGYHHLLVISSYLHQNWYAGEQSVKWLEAYISLSAGGISHNIGHIPLQISHIHHIDKLEGKHDIGSYLHQILCGFYVLVKFESHLHQIFHGLYLLLKLIFPKRWTYQPPWWSNWLVGLLGLD